MDKDVKYWEEKECDHCHHQFTVYQDPDGIWVECACDAGYVN